MFYLKMALALQGLLWFHTHMEPEWLIGKWELPTPSAIEETGK